MMTQSQVNLAIRLSEILGWGKIQSHIVLPTLEPLILQLERFGITNSAIALKPKDLWKHLSTCPINGNHPTPKRQRIIQEHYLAIEQLMRHGVSFVDASQQIFEKYKD